MGTYFLYSKDILLSKHFYSSIDYHDTGLETQIDRKAFLKKRFAVYLSVVLLG